MSAKYVKVYTKPVYRTSVHKTILLYKYNWSRKKGMYMDRQNLGIYRDGTLPTGFVYIINHYTSFVYTCTVTGFVYTCTLHTALSWFCVIQGEIQFWGQTIRQTH